MEIFQALLHLDKYLAVLINSFGSLIYLILFIILFAETGLVITPFLPGDSLLFAVGTLAGGNLLNIYIVYPLLLLATITGDNVNYWLGHHFGSKVFSKDNSRIFNKKYLEKTSEFYRKYGGKTIILARYVPIVRTFSPFVAGIGKMPYKTFLFNSLAGGFLWVTGLTFAGYFFGQMPIIKNNFEFAIIGIIFVSLLPMFYEFIKHKLKGNKEIEKDASYKEIKDLFDKDHLKD